MNGVTPQIALSGWVGVLMFAVGVAVAVYITLNDPESPLAKQYFRYVRHLDGERAHQVVDEVALELGEEGLGGGSGGEHIPVIGGEEGREGGSGSGSGIGIGSGSGDDSGSGSDDEEEEEDDRRYKVGDKVRIKGRSGDNVGVVTAINPDGTYVIKKLYI
jgi:hypothetical protein